MRDEEMSQILRIFAQEKQQEASAEVPLFLAAKGISNLFHFTRLENLESIFEYGLLGREDLVRRKIDFFVTDEYRQEPIENGICCSIGIVNKYMLTKKLNTFSKNLVLLEMSPANELLKNKNYLAIPGNFGRTVHKGRLQQFPEEYLGGKGLMNIYLNQPLRAKYQLHPSEPTDPQSEIIFLDPIEPGFIKRLILPSDAAPTAISYVKSFLHDNGRDLIVESGYSSKFKTVRWNEQESIEFQERKWSESWN